jgi:hypothetical protein
MLRRLASCAFPVLLTLMTSVVFGQQSPPPQANAAPTVGATTKNILVLTDLKDQPTAALISAMQFMAGSLSVSCSYCHVSQSGPYDSDANQRKLVARDMIRMTRSINATSFGGRQVVTCSTCHQGHPRPAVMPDPWYKTPEEIAAYRATIPNLPPATGPLAPARAATTPEPAASLPSVDQLMTRYHSAVSAAPVKSIRIAGVNAVALGPSTPFELEGLLPDRFSLVTQGGAVRIIVNGHRAWRVTSQGASEVPSAQISTLLTTIDALLPIKYETATAPRGVSGVKTIGGRRYYVVESRPADRVEQLYFDVETALPYKIRNEFPTALGTRVEERAFEDYRTLGGVTLAWRVTSHYMEDQSVFQILDAQSNVEIDPTRFEPPKIKQQ